MPLRYTQAADDDLRAIYRTSVELFGVRQAEIYVATLRRVCDFLSDYPRAVRERPEIDIPVRARAAKSHVIIYEVGENETAVILRFRHVREDWMEDPING